MSNNISNDFFNPFDTTSEQINENQVSTTDTSEQGFVVSEGFTRAADSSSTISATKNLDKIQIVGKDGIQVSLSSVSSTTAKFTISAPTFSLGQAQLASGLTVNTGATGRLAYYQDPSNISASSQNLTYDSGSGALNYTIGNISELVNILNSDSNKGIRFNFSSGNPSKVYGDSGTLVMQSQGSILTLSSSASSGISFEQSYITTQYGIVVENPSLWHTTNSRNVSLKIAAPNNSVPIHVGTSDFIIDKTTTANVGIGTATPSYKLHVVGDVSGSDAHFDNAFVNHLTSSDDLTIGGDGNFARIRLRRSDDAVVGEIFQNAGTTDIINNQGSGIRLMYQGTPLMHAKTTGVSLGYSQTNLHQVTGSIHISGATTGHLTASGHVSASVFYGDGSNLTGIDFDPVGNNTEVQFNDSGTFGASSDFTWNDSSKQLTVNGQFTLQNNSPILKIKNNQTNAFGMELDYGGVKIYSVKSYLPSGEIRHDTAGNSYYQTFYADGNKVLTLRGASGGSTEITGSMIISGSSHTIKGDLTLVDPTNAGSSRLYFQSGGSVAPYIGTQTNQIEMNAGSYGITLKNNTTNTMRILSNRVGIALGAEPQKTLEVGGEVRLGASIANIHQITGSVDATGNLTASGHVSASAFYGDGSALTNLPPGGISSVVEDTDPQLGGDLDMNGQIITGTLETSGNFNIQGPAKTGQENQPTWIPRVYSNNGQLVLQGGQNTSTNIVIAGGNIQNNGNFLAYGVNNLVRLQDGNSNGRFRMFEANSGRDRLEMHAFNKYTNFYVHQASPYVFRIVDGSGSSDVGNDYLTISGSDQSMKLSGSVISAISDTFELTGSKFLFDSTQTNDVGLVYTPSTLTMRHGASSIQVRNSNIVSIGGGLLSSPAGLWVNGSGSPHYTINGKGWSLRADNTNGYYMHLGSSGSPKFTVTGSSVGINTDTPAASLDVNGTFNASGYSFTTDNTTVVLSASSPSQAAISLKGNTDIYEDTRIRGELSLGFIGQDATINLARSSNGVTVGQIVQTNAITYYDNLQGSGIKFRVAGTSLFEMMHIKSTGVDIGRVGTDISTVNGALHFDSAATSKLGGSGDIVNGSRVYLPRGNAYLDVGNPAHSVRCVGASVQANLRNDYGQDAYFHVKGQSDTNPALKVNSYAYASAPPLIEMSASATQITGDLEVTGTLDVSDNITNISNGSTFSIKNAGGSFRFKDSGTSDLLIIEDSGINIKGATNGKLTINNSTAGSYRLDVREETSVSDTNKYIARFWNDGNDADAFGIIVQCGQDASTSLDKAIVYFDARDGDGDSTGQLGVNTSGVFSLQDISDERLKENIRKTEIKALDVISETGIYDYEWKKTGVTRKCGFVAQDLEKQFPEAVSEYEESTGEKTKMVSESMLIPVLTKAIQEQQEMIEQLLNRVEELENK